jgi:hypothetical protein
MAGTPEKGRLPGGEVPDVGRILSDTTAEFMADLGPYALAGLGYQLVVVPVVIVMFLGIYLGLTVFIALGLVASLSGAFVVGEIFGPDLGALAAFVLQMIAFAASFLVLGALTLVLAAPLAVVHAGLVRAIAAHQRGDEVLDLGAPFRHMRGGLSSIMVAFALYGGLVLVGAVMCYLPALLVPLFFGFALTLVSLHGRGAVAGFRESLAAMLAHPQQHVALWGLSLVLGLVGAYVPVIGPMFALALHVRAHRTIFGDPAAV